MLMFIFVLDFILMTRWQSSSSLDMHGGNLKKFFVLPDFQSIIRGFVREDDVETQQGEQVRVPPLAFLIMYLYHIQLHLYNIHAFIDTNALLLV